MKKGIQKRKRGLSAVVMVLILALMSTGCATFDHFMESFRGEENQEDVIRIGIFEPLSGVDQEAGELELAGIELAQELYPKVLGKDVELVYGDNKSQIALAETVAQELIDKRVSVVLGSYGNSLSLAGGEYFKNAQIPAIGITCTNPLVTKGNPYYFRACIVDSFQGVMAAKYIYNDLGVERAVIMKASDDDYGAALSQQFSDKLVSLTGKEDAIISTVEYAPEATDYKNQLAVIKTAKPEVVFLPVTAKEGASIVKQARAEGIESLFLGTDLWHEDILIEEGGVAAEGLVFTTYFDAESTLTDTTEEFLSAYREKYGEEETPESAVALGFDAYLLALDAIKRQAELENSTEEASEETTLCSVLQDTKEFQGATGSITFDKNGDPIKSVVFIAVENGEFIYKYTVEPEWD